LGSIVADSKGTVYFWDNPDATTTKSYILKYAGSDGVVRPLLISNPPSTAKDSYIYNNASYTDLAIDSKDVLWVNTGCGIAQFTLNDLPKVQRTMLSTFGGYTIGGTYGGFGGRGAIVDKEGNYIVTDSFSRSLYKISKNPFVINNRFNWMCVLGKCEKEAYGQRDGTGPNAELRYISRLVQDSTGTIFLVEGQMYIRKITKADGFYYKSLMIAGQGGDWVDGLAAMGTDFLPSSAPGGLWNMRGLAIDDFGNLYTLSRGCIRKLSPTSSGQYQVSTFMCDETSGDGTATASAAKPGHTAYVRISKGIFQARALVASKCFLFVTIMKNLDPGNIYKIPIC